MRFHALQLNNRPEDGLKDSNPILKWSAVALQGLRQDCFQSKGRRDVCGGGPDGMSHNLGVRSIPLRSYDEIIFRRRCKQTIV